MRLNSKLIWGLAWTGLALVLAVPSLDAVTRMGGDSAASAVLTSDIEPVRPAAPAAPTAEPATAELAITVTTTRTPNGVIITPAGSTLPKPGAGVTDPVDKLLASGKTLPDYISDGGTKPADTQVAAITPTPAATPAVAPVKPPVPFPAWARPAPTPLAAPPAAAQTAALPKAPVVATPPAAAAPAEPVVIIDETSLTGSVRAPAGPLPPAAIVDDSDNWDTESLRQYLERRGILEGSSSASVTERSARESRRQRLDRLLRESGDDTTSFTLF
jgi:hypothetical protein